MKLDEYKKQNQLNLKQRAISFLMDGDSILLGKRKEGIGEGFWVGIGGKKEQDEDIIETAARELKEEINILPTRITELGTVYYYFEDEEHKSWSQEVVVFSCTEWEGEPKESEEILPQWFNLNEMPYAQMWDDAKYFLVKLFQNKINRGEFLYNDQFKVIDYRMWKE